MIRYELDGDPTIASILLTAAHEEVIGGGLRCHETLVHGAGQLAHCRTNAALPRCVSEVLLLEDGAMHALAVTRTIDVSLLGKIRTLVPAHQTMSFRDHNGRNDQLEEG